MSGVKKLILNNLIFIKAIIIAFMAIVAFFVDMARGLFHWGGISYVTLTAILLFLEYVGHKENQLPPLEKMKKYLLDFSGWKQGGSENPDYYSSVPELTIHYIDHDDLDFKQEWTRGEIGAHYDIGNGAYYADLYHHNTLLKRIHVVIFDGGKKTIVTPDWEAIGKGRVYFYLEDSIEYAFQKYLSCLHGKDFSKNIRKSGGEGDFDVPVFKDRQQLESFKEFCATPDHEHPEQDTEQQNKIFYSLLEKYEEFKKEKNGAPTKAESVQK